ncbi:MAG TPA: RluA family pseudouridine synthase [Terriglobales bacterium]|nr:RluA family pseudouridine synthase [Terriglobales bacterium]
MPNPNHYTFLVSTEDASKRLDQFLVSKLPEVSRARVQQLISENKVLVNGTPSKASFRLRGGERIEIVGQVEELPLRAIPEDIPLDVVYEDEDLAVINKPAGMMVHAGAGATEDARNRGTLVNALLHRLGALSKVGGTLRPGIVHRLDRGTSGLLVVAKNDLAHRRLAEQFAGRKAKKTYIALVHGSLKQDSGTVHNNLGRDPVHRTRMAIRRVGGREAITHYRVCRRIDSMYGKFTLLEIKIDTGRTHQIRVHMSSLKHPVLGDTVYGAPRELKPNRSSDRSGTRPPILSLSRYFLHSAALQIEHPIRGALLSFSTPLPPELREFMAILEQIR